MMQFLWSKTIEHVIGNTSGKKSELPTAQGMYKYQVFQHHVTACIDSNSMFPRASSPSSTCSVKVERDKDRC